MNRVRIKEQMSFNGYLTYVLMYYDSYHRHWYPVYASVDKNHLQNYVRLAYRRSFEESPFRKRCGVAEISGHYEYINRNKDQLIAMVMK